MYKYNGHRYGGSDKNVESKNQADSATEIPKTGSGSMKVVQDQF